MILDTVCVQNEKYCPTGFDKLNFAFLGSGLITPLTPKWLRTDDSLKTFEIYVQFLQH